LGYNHFGDQDNWNGYIFIPVEGPNKPPIIAVFNESNLHYIDCAKIKGTHSAWCAINPISTHLTTSHSSISQSQPIEVYSINWELLESSNKLVLTPEKGYHLKNLPSSWNNQVMAAICI